MSDARLATIDDLLLCDHPSAIDAPPGFERATELERVRGAMSELRQALGMELQLDDQVQDATFFASIQSTEKERIRVQAVDLLRPFIAIYFSSYGGLVRIWSPGPNKVLAAEFAKTAAQVLARRGFTVVPDELAGQPYTGGNKVFVGDTWEHRFFDYY